MKRILVIDDEKDFCFFLKQNLESSGDFAVEVCSNALEGFTQVRKLHPDMVLLDVRMPGMGGGDIATAIKENQETKDIPFAFITALKEQFNLKNKELSVSGELFITKPVKIKELVRIIDTYTA